VAYLEGWRHGSQDLRVFAAAMYFHTPLGKRTGTWLIEPSLVRLRPTTVVQLLSHGSSRSCFAVFLSSGRHRSMPLTNARNSSFFLPSRQVSDLSKLRSWGIGTSAFQSPDDVSVRRCLLTAIQVRAGPYHLP